ncbi:OmpA family protein [Nocardia sp. CC201C]|uniref:OmpA family protein n=1 Tax=Nocardia sp. CC201C TaxID=3044575 RepID=UPI0024A856B7|nr:OmpA family protein [Nocardia sp. CC201C]
MSIPRVPRSWHPLVFLTLALALLGVISGCSTKQAEPQSITIVVTATAAEPAVDLTAAVEERLTAMAAASDAPGGALVRIVWSVTAPPITVDLTPTRSNGEIEHSPGARQKKIAQAVMDLSARLQAITADRPGLDVLGLVDRASLLPPGDLVVISSGLSTENPTDWRQLGFDSEPDSIAASVRQQGRLPKLSGRHVTFVGLGQSAGMQAALPPFMREQVTQVWLALCKQAGAASCTAVSRDDMAPPVAPLPVPVIEIPASHTENGCPVWVRLSQEEQLRFAADSDQLLLPDAADAVLLPIVEAAQRCSLVIDVAGFIADIGDGRDSSNLSGRRAAAVAARMQQLGLPLSHLGTVVGRGTADPLVASFVQGRFDERQAALNRRVELSFRRLN